MLILLSPAKTMNSSLVNNNKEYSMPIFADDAFTIVKEIRKLGIDEISHIMGLSPKLSELNYHRFKSYRKSHSTENSKQAILTYNGDAYMGLNATSFTIQDFIYAQNHLAIFSGLYGYLRPLDLIQTYRLEMSTPININISKSLVTFWMKKVTAQINKEIKKEGHEFIINLASQSYFKTVDSKNIKAKIMNINFSEKRNNKTVFVSFNAKKARGMMAAYILKNRITKVEDICNFSNSAYVFDKKSSTELNINFIN